MKTIDEPISTGQFGLLMGQMAHLQQQVADMDRKLSTAFAGNDIEGHRRYHEAMIAKTERQVRIMDAIIEKSLHGVIWAVVLLIGSAVWAYVKKNLD